MAEASRLAAWTDRGVQAGVAERFRVIHVEIGIRAALDDHGVDAQSGCPIEVGRVYRDGYRTAVGRERP